MDVRNHQVLTINTMLMYLTSGKWHANLKVKSILTDVPVNKGKDDMECRVGKYSKSGNSYLVPLCQRCYTVKKK